jgi:hypothetical protein
MTYGFSDKEKLKVAIYDYTDGVYDHEEVHKLVDLCTKLRECSDKLPSYTEKVFMGNINKIYLLGSDEEGVCFTYGEAAQRFKAVIIYMDDARSNAD